MGTKGMPRRAKDKVQTLSVMDMIEQPQSVFRGSNWTRWIWARWGNRYLSERQRACLDSWEDERVFLSGGCDFGQSESDLLSWSGTIVLGKLLHSLMGKERGKE
jgi:hypothetical protein